MATIVRGTIPAEELALHTVLSQLPDVKFETEQIVESGDEAVMPLLWIRGAETESVLDACEDDPSVDNVLVLSAFDREQLYRMDWVDDVQLLLQMVTNSQATILSAFGANDKWHLRVLYPTRESLNKTHAFCEDHNLTFEIDAICEMNGGPSGRYGLTSQQRVALVRAVESGYYEIPRETDLKDMAEDMDISHQALSERIRRGTETLVQDTLMMHEPT
jgi:hypothetical protein